MTVLQRRDNGTGIVVVFYRPDADCIVRANRLALAGRCVVVDNTESVSDPAEIGLDPDIDYIANGANLGIATALNQGIEHVRTAGCSMVLLFDQDSEPTQELLGSLPAAVESARRANPKVAVIGPAYEDVRLNGVAPFVRFGFGKLRRVPPRGAELIETDFLITSGSCLNLHVWQDIGPMEDGLFIDFVDLEWCIRARAKGYSVLGASALRLRHELGGEPVSVFGRRYPSHGPLRHYYLFRNAVALMRRRYVPLSWKSTEIVKIPVRLLIYGLFMRPRLRHVGMSLLGMWHGMIGRDGAFGRP